MSKKSSIEQPFVFWCPIEKATQRVVDPTTGEEEMVLGGIASTADKDADGEYLDPKGFDINPLLTSGLVNWHHQAKGQPATIIGEPRKAEIRKEGLYIETVLYPSSKIAHDVWELAQTLERDSKTRRLGYSIEGKVLKRKSDDKNSPDYNHIDKAVITGVAITHMPKNPKTFANIIKGEIDDEEEEVEKDGTETSQESTSAAQAQESAGLNTDKGRALMPESVDGVKKKTFNKAEVLERLFKDIPGISIAKAEDIYIMLNKYAIMKEHKNITEEDLQKAYEVLGLNVESAEEEVEKGEQTEKGCGSGDGGSEKVLKKAKAKKEDEEEETEETEETETEEEEVEEAQETEETETEETTEQKKVEKGGNNRFDRLEKALATSYMGTEKGLRAVGVLIKGLQSDLQASRQENAELRELCKSNQDELENMRTALEAFGAQVPARKSISAARVVERGFQKGNDNDLEKGGAGKGEGKGDGGPTVVSMSRNRALVAEILDQATFAKGFDEEFSKACVSFEATHVLPENVIQRIKAEYGFEIVK